MEAIDPRLVVVCMLRRANMLAESNGEITKVVIYLSKYPSVS